MLLNRLLYFGDFFACPIVVFILVAMELTQGSLHVTGIFVCACIAGFGAWTLLEYSIHRWLYHKVAFFDRMHDAHHQKPTSLVGAPSFLGIAIIFALFFIPLRLFDPAIASGFTCGVLSGYFAYMLVHHAAHHWVLSRDSYLYRARLRHMAHHYRDGQRNFGVITDFWDRVFSTHVETHREAATRS